MTLYNFQSLAHSLRHFQSYHHSIFYCLISIISYQYNRKTR